MNLLGIHELNAKQIESILALAAELKEKRKRGLNGEQLKGRTLAMLFEKSSTRTRVSFESAMTQLGGHAMYIDYVTSQLSRGETLADTARILSRYCDGIMARLYKHADLLELAKASSVPVINGLTDLEHPCQALGDLLTMREKGKLRKGAKFAFMGDCANNMANSLMLAAAKLGMSVVLVHPPGYPANERIVREAKKSGRVEETSEVLKGVRGADVVYTDVWVSMGMEDEKAERMKAFIGYQVNGAVMRAAGKGAIFMHCLPAHRGLEVSADVIDGKQSVVWDQAENRLHVQKAVLLQLLGKK